MPWTLVLEPTEPSGRRITDESVSDVTKPIGDKGTCDQPVGLSVALGHVVYWSHRKYSVTFVNITAKDLFPECCRQKLRFTYCTLYWIFQLSDDPVCYMNIHLYHARICCYTLGLFAKTCSFQWSLSGLISLLFILLDEERKKKAYAKVFKNVCCHSLLFPAHNHFIIFKKSLQCVFPDCIDLGGFSTACWNL